MEFSIPADLKVEIKHFNEFLKSEVISNLAAWNRDRAIPRRFFQLAGQAGWYGFGWRDGRMVKHSGLRETLILERLATVSPGVAVAVLIVSDLGLTVLKYFGTAEHRSLYGAAAVSGDCLICFGNTENLAGSDAAGIKMTAKKTNGGWVLNGAKAYTTNGNVSDFAVVTAVTDPDAHRNRRISMFLVDLNTAGISRKKLNKQVWIPSDLTRIDFEDVHVSKGCLMGQRRPRPAADANGIYQQPYSH